MLRKDKQNAIRNRTESDHHYEDEILILFLLISLHMYTM